LLAVSEERIQIAAGALGKQGLPDWMCRKSIELAFHCRAGERKHRIKC
jgi:hypothetical protein